MIQLFDSLREKLQNSIYIIDTLIGYEFAKDDKITEDEKNMLSAKNSYGYKKKLNTWNKVTELLPGVEGEYIVFTKNNIIMLSYCDSSGKFCCYKDYLYDVTHWMQLPEPPTNNNKEQVK